MCTKYAHCLVAVIIDTWFVYLSVTFFGFVYSEVFFSALLLDSNITRCLLSPLIGVNDRGLLLRDPCMLRLSPLEVECTTSSLLRVLSPYSPEVFRSPTGPWCAPMPLLTYLMLPPHGVRFLPLSLLGVLNSALKVCWAIKSPMCVILPTCPRQVRLPSSMSLCGVLRWTVTFKRTFSYFTSPTRVNLTWTSLLKVLHSSPSEVRSYTYWLLTVLTLLTFKDTRQNTSSQWGVFLDPMDREPADTLLVGWLSCVWRSLLLAVTFQ